MKTSKSKKLLSLLLSVLLAFSVFTVVPFSVYAADETEPVYVVAGMEAFCNGLNWVGDAAAAPENVMEKNGDVYELVYPAAQPGDSLQVKVVENLADGTLNWIGVGSTKNDNLTFNITAECDVTVTYNPATQEITVTGDNVVIPTGLDIEYINAVGNGDGNWLNGIGWDPADRTNEMEMISEGVYQITFPEVEEHNTWQVKFAVNGSWAANWGGKFEGFGAKSNADFNGSDITIDTTGMDVCDIILTLDLTNFDFATKEGATFKVDAIFNGELVTQPTTEPDTTAPETEPATKAIYGDVDHDGDITIMDATMIQKHVTELNTLPAADEVLADVDQDGSISILDATMVQKYLAELTGSGLTGMPVKEEPTTEPETEPTTEPDTEPTTEPVPAKPVYVVAGVEALCNGINWVGDAALAPENVMTHVDNSFGDDYVLTYTDVQPGNGLQFKIVENLADGTMSWIGVGSTKNDNFTFNVTDVCDVTITFNFESKKITVTGEHVVIPTGLDIEYINAVGNGDGNWLNGINWDPSDRTNEMTEIADGIYQIRFDDVEEHNTWEVKFAANGSWAANWGGKFEGFGVATPAVFNSQDNITINTMDMGECDIILTLDLTNFVFETKEGATFTVIAITDTPDPDPTTEPDTEPTTEPVEEEAVFVVAGMEAFCNGMNWVGDATLVPENVMEKNGDVYELVFSAAQPGDSLQIKVVENLADGTMNWIGVGSTKNDNLTFNITAECDVTVTYNPATQEITVTGEHVVIPTGLDIEYINAVGNGDGNWLNGIGWDPSDRTNEMAEIADGIYQIRFDGVEEHNTWEVKFAANGSWAANWGGKFEGFDVATPAVFNSQDNITINTMDMGECDIILTLDLTNFVFETKEGATFTVIAITADTPDPDPTTEPVEEEAVYVVAGMEAFCNGMNWVGDATLVPENVMEKNGDVYELVFPAAQPGDSLQIKVVENLADGTMNWIGVGSTKNDNLTFNITAECDVTVTYNPATQEITVTGEHVVIPTGLDIEYINAVGNGDGNWLNGIGWDPADRTNEMIEIADGIYQIRFDDVEEHNTWEVKFAANGSWAANWGGKFEGFDVATPAVFNSQDNITINTMDMGECDIILTLDLTNFVFETKEGATFTIQAIAK